MKQEHKWEIYWPNGILFLLLHISAVYGLYLKRYSLPATEFFAKSVAYMSCIGVTAGAHRLWCHKSYKATKLGQIILMFMASMAYQNSVYIWCRDHRMHHRYSETDADPHNAKRGFFFSHIGWLMVRKHPSLRCKTNVIDLSDLKADQIVMFQHIYRYPILFLCTVCITTCLPWCLWGESLKISFFRATIYRYVVVVNLMWCVNSLAHLYGNKPYERKIGPVECKLIQYMVPGEGFHNYHHTFSWDYKASEFGGDAKNTTTLFIDCLAWLGLAYERKTVPPAEVKSRMIRTGDGSYNTNTTFLFQQLPIFIDTFLKNVFTVITTLMFLYIL